MVKIAIDFDGTITLPSEWPYIGEMRLDAKYYINKLVDDGHCILIWSCRCGDSEKEAIKWLNDNGIKFMHFNENCKRGIHLYGNDTRKIGADIYIDDKSIYALKYGINWRKIYEIIMDVI